MTVSASNTNHRVQQSVATSAASAYASAAYPTVYPALPQSSVLSSTPTIDSSKATITNHQQPQPFFAKAKDSSSPGSGHEASTDLLPITSPHLAIGASPTTTWQLLVCTYYYHQQALFSPLKDDVFLAPAIADNESVITSSSEAAHSASSVGNWVPTPCLSPVTSPSDFLCNHEPLFDGIEEDLQHQQQQQKEEEQQKQQQQDEHQPEYFSDDESQSTKSKPESVPTLDWCDEASSPAMSFYGDDDESASAEPQVPPPDQFLVDDIEINSSDDEQLLQQPQDDDPFPIVSRGIKRKHSKFLDSSDDQEDQADDDGDESDGNERVRLPSSLVQLAEHRRPPRAKPVRRRTKRHAGRRARPAKPIYIDPCTNEDGGAEDDGKYTIFERLTLAGIDWCRYCGTTEGVNWRPGPWGKRTLCNKHGCDYKGYGIASRLPRLDLSAFSNEKLEDRKRPVVQQFCVVCRGSESVKDNRLVPCEGGCSRAYHQLCRMPQITESAFQDQQWCCSTVCRENKKRNKVFPYDA